MYIDDIIVFGRTFVEQLTRLEEVFARLATAGLRLKPSKCHLFKDEVEFLGHVVTREGVKTDPAKVHQLVHWARPATVSDVRAFLGFAGYYRRFVRDFATLCRPLHALTQQGRSFEWTDECEHVFCTLKDKLSRAPVLMYPRYGCDAPRFVLDVDASGVGLGAVLSQADSEGCERPVAFASRSLTDTEQRYASTKSELLGIVWAFRHFRCYLLGRPFLVRTDHRALEHLSRFKDPPAIIARWLEFLSEFDYVMQYRAGRSHANADGLSRLPGKASAVASVSANTVAEHVVPSPLVQRRGWTLQDWRDCQSRDTDLSQLATLLSGDESAEVTDLTGVSPAFRSYWRGRQRMFVREGVVCRKWEDPCVSVPPRTQVLVPVNQRTAVLSEYHDHGGHWGVQRTYAQLSLRFHWYGMKRDVEDWVASCESCSQRRKPAQRGRGAPLQVTWCGYPFERIAMDLIPNLPETVRGNKHILVIADYFTKWVEAYPLQRMDAETIASAFASEFVARYGAPESIHTDQGRNFDSALFKQVCSLLGIRKTRTTAYHPASDGLVERFNQTLEKVLSHYVSDHQRDWDTHLPAMLLAYRATPQTSTGYTPAYLLFGRELCLPQDVAYGLPPVTTARAETTAGYVKELRLSLQETHAFVRDKLRAVHRHQAHLHDAGAVLVSFEVGDLVWMLVPAIPVGTSAKFAKLWRGPFEVMTKLSSVLYRVRDPVGKRGVMIVHVNRLKKCLVRPQHLQPVPEEVEPVGDSGCNPAKVRQPEAYQPDATDLLYQDECDNGENYGGEPAVMAQVHAPIPQLPPVVQLPQTPYAMARPQRNRRPPARF